mgnify:CR=1 FL=1
MSNGKTMLIAYDGTERADRALEYAAQLLRPSTVEILTCLLYTSPSPRD